MKDEERFVSWLHDAYAMEESILQTLQYQASNLDKKSPLYQEIVKHIDMTKHHQASVEKCLSRYNESPSPIKNALGWLGSQLGLIGSGAFQDGVLSEVIADIAAEQYEIAVYRSLVIAATDLADEKSVLVFEEIIKQEQAMAEFLTESLKIIVNSALQKHEE